MTDQQINIAIAEKCGRKQLIPGKDIWTSPSGQSVVGIPNYSTDLNAMHEAEKVLTPEQSSEYANKLIFISAHINPDQLGHNHLFMFCNATARQRAEAFMTTFGLWRKT